MALSPFGPTWSQSTSYAWSLNELGRFDEARAVITRMTVRREVLLTELDMSAGRWAVAESIATAHLDDTSVAPDFPGGLLWHLGVIQCARGSLGASVATLQHAEDVGWAVEDPWFAVFVLRLRLEHAVVSDGLLSLPLEGGTGDSSLTMTLLRGLRATAAADLPGARRSLSLVRARPERELKQHGAAPALLEARIAILEGRTSSPLAPGCDRLPPPRPDALSARKRPASWPRDRSG